MEKYRQLLVQFKESFRIMTDNPWSDALDTWLEGIGHMYQRGIDIPNKYEYVLPKYGKVTESDSLFHEMFIIYSNEEVIFITEFLFRYLRFLKHCGASEE